MRAFRVILRSVGVAALLAVLVVALFGGREPLAAGSVAPPVERARLGDGRIATLKLVSDRPTVINIWATWCPPCLAEIPDLVAANKGWGGRARFIGLAAESERAKVLDLVARFGIDYDIAEIDGRTAHAWNATSLPSTYIVGADGRILWSIRGQVDRETLDAELTRILGSAPTPAAPTSGQTPGPRPG